MAFQQDNAASHLIIHTQNTFIQNNNYVMDPSPAISPDLNPLEPQWNMIDHAMRDMNSIEYRPEDHFASAAKPHQGLEGHFAGC